MQNKYLVKDEQYIVGPVMMEKPIPYTRDDGTIKDSAFSSLLTDKLVSQYEDKLSAYNAHIASLPTILRQDNGKWKVGQELELDRDFQLKPSAIFVLGNYTNKCSSCQNQFEGTARRWYLCPSCCNKPVAIPIEQKEQEAVNPDRELIEFATAISMETIAERDQPTQQVDNVTDKSYQLFKENFIAHVDRLLRDRGASNKDVFECLELAFNDLAPQADNVTVTFQTPNSLSACLKEHPELYTGSICMRCLKTADKCTAFTMQDFEKWLMLASLVPPTNDQEAYEKLALEVHELGRNKPFFIDTFRALLGKYDNEEISMSKLVETLNVEALNWHKKQLVAQPTQHPVSAEEVKAAWDMALTLANNLCVKISDSYNNDDFTKEADVAGECGKKVRAYIGNYIPELAALQAAQPSSSLIDMDWFENKLLSYKQMRDGYKEHTPQWEVYDLMVREYCQILDKLQEPTPSTAKEAILQADNSKQSKS